MKKSENMSLKDRITIHIKSAKPVRLLFLLIACVIIFELILLCGMRISFASDDKATGALIKEDNQLRITVVGEMAVTDEIRLLANTTSYSSLLDNLQPYWQNSDYVLATLAGPVLTYNVNHYTSTRDSNEESIYLRPAALRGFAEAGITGFNFATDDAYNYGVTGLLSTIREADELGLCYFGIEENSDKQIYRYLTFDAVGADGEAQTRAVAVLSVNGVIRSHSTVRESRAGVINSSIETLYLQVYEASQKSDLTVVLLHDGKKGSFSVTDDQELTAHALIDSGADIVVCTHSDIVQTIELYRDGLILYGIGELFSASYYSYLLNSAMLDLIVDGEGGIFAYVTPLRIEEGVARITDSSFYRSYITKLLTSGLSEDEYTITEDGQICISLGSIPDEPVYQAESDTGGSE